ncbi:chemotaxis protein CheW [Paenibacillus monticola]|uniref:Chemotaxis protein CheW n=1 Tax=Paenibacillus monticola TaxID=2666075 RepID=A0A7X2H0Q7_9BACL|nr:chemotaxis protein CheW [Paenibacillus monticola]MRN51424.1 chemotaxis protein CheW [Paenibacillus monticola]
MTVISEQYIVSRLGNERHAFNIRDINEIIKMEFITEVPNSKPYIKGVINLRGKIVPVVSMCRRFGIPETPIGKLSRIVVVQYQNEATGIIVDAVEKVTSFDDIQPPVDTNEPNGTQFMDGIGQSVDGLVGILNIDRLFGEG